jgi:threonine/homoserine/homoserine lactone efflux protein
MYRYLVVGLLLGLLSGIVPGPFSAVVAATGLEGGFWAAFWVAVVPVLSETFVLIVSALVVSQLPRVVLQWMGMAGGVLLLYLAWRVWRAADESSAPEVARGPRRRRIVEGLALALISPVPWVFWLLVGAPIFLSAYRAGLGHGVVFLGAFLVGLVGVHLVIAALAGYGQKKLPPAWHRRLGRGTSVALLAGAAVLVWQSWIGNFERMVAGSREIQEEIVGDSTESSEGSQGSIR